MQRSSVQSRPPRAHLAVAARTGAGRRVAPGRSRRPARELANIANRKNAIEEGRARYTEALAIYRTHGDLRGETAVLNNLGTLEQDVGNQATSRALLEQALVYYFVTWAMTRGAAKALNNLANLAAAGEGA